MKTLAVAAALIAASNAGPAEACGPPQTCGNVYCRDVTTVVEGTVKSIQVSDVEGRNTATIDVTAVHGDRVGVAPGTSNTIELGDSYPVGDGDVGKTLVLGLTRAGNGVLQIDSRVALSDPYTVSCFGANATGATVADTLLSPSCYDTLVPVPPSGSGCPDDDATYCDAGGARGSLWVLAALGLVVRRRARRGTVSRRAC